MSVRDSKNPRRVAMEIARHHAKRVGLPERMDGVTVLLASYADEDTLRFMKANDPELTLEMQRLLNDEFGEICSRRGANVVLVPVDVGDYFGWIGRHRLENTPTNRVQYISWLTCAEPKFEPREGGFKPSKS